MAGGSIDNRSGVSVVICCYNSASRLPETLKHLAQQYIPENFLLEIIVVNNASIDDTAACAVEIWNRFQTENIEFKITDEPRPGQMFARKKGVNEARFEYIIFCDDDNWLDKNYVSLAKMVLEKDVMIGAAGGRNFPVTDANEYPPWFESVKDRYAIGTSAAISGNVSEKGFVLGAGMVTRKSLFLQINDDKYPSLLKGRNGGKLTTGDDFEYCKRLLLWGYELYYDEAMKLYHFIPKERLTLTYRENLEQGISQAGLILNEYDKAIRVLKRNKDKNRWRLLFLSPFRILLARLGLSKRVLTDEKLTLFYLAPFAVRRDPVKSIIKKLIYHK